MRKALIVLSCLLLPALAMAQVPMVDAGPDQTIYLGDSVTLHGTATGDPGVWLWEVVSAPTGSNYNLFDADTADAIFSTDTVGDYLVTFEAWNYSGWSDPDAVIVTVVQNQPPTAVASATPLSGPAPLLVSFDGTLSSDPEAGALVYDWTFDDGTFGSGATPSHSYDVPGVYQAVLIVLDERGLADFVFIDIITVCGGSINCPPVADAGEDQTVYLDEPVQLSGAASDHDGDEIVSWTWSIESAPGGSSASFNDPGISDPVFSPDLLGAYVLSLVVSDGEDTSDPDTLTITVEEPPPAWGEASVVGMESASPAKGLNYLIALLFPISAVLLWKGLRKRK